MTDDFNNLPYEFKPEFEDKLEQNALPDPVINPNQVITLRTSYGERATSLLKIAHRLPTPDGSQDAHPFLRAHHDTDIDGLFRVLYTFLINFNWYSPFDAS